ncbi:hypothetical protein DOTSEDRAFT_41925 [Dothistroma septosporum NZE10]|uniref:Uncharacterized protein n=1 Tax=Dothistroma septosporum (strain NZE10 / CBS 128990) TaxID=675120 RepID=N1PVM9_DOTSN|nr:hypothetical protein DOTSEDRAFT_41925 [Dothistroma septosporum NZE10]
MLRCTFVLWLDDIEDVMEDAIENAQQVASRVASRAGGFGENPQHEAEDLLGNAAEDLAEPAVQKLQRA